MKKELTPSDVKGFAKDFDGDPALSVSKNATMRNGVFNAAYVGEEVRNLPNTFSHEVKDIGSITNQKSSGRCWMFSGLNVLRIAAMKKLRVKDFEFSESYLMFWDKLEKSNYQLESVLSTLDEPDNSRVFDTVVGLGGQQDGGFWAFFTALVKKYGVCPKTAMPETASSSSSSEMDAVINHKLAQFSSHLRREHRKGASLDELRSQKKAMLSEIYRILTICLGKPVDSFTYEWRASPTPAKGKKASKKEGKEVWETFSGTPLEFYEKYVGIDLDDYVVITHGPVRDLKFGKNYAVEYALNVVGTPLHGFVNVPLDVLKKAAIDSLKDGKALWFDCDVSALSVRKEGYLDDKLIDLEGLFHTSFEFDKGESLVFRNTQANHAMTLVGVNLSAEGEPDRWKVENSWGKDVGSDGIFVMSDSWFDRFVYGLVVDKKFLPKDVVAASKTKPTLLPAWSPVNLSK